MIDVYLPIAEISVNIFFLLSIGLVCGILSGLFGVGGGFILTPFLIFMGISPAIAVASSANSILGTSFSGFLSHYRRGNIDFKMATIMIIGGFIGSSYGVFLFKKLQNIGQIDLVISFSYIVILGFIATLMMIDSLKQLFKKKLVTTKVKSSSSTPLNRAVSSLPFQIDFTKSNIRISIIIPFLISLLASVLVSIMGIGGGFILITLMAYVLKMPSQVIIGTSMLQIVFTTANVTFWQASINGTVDIILVLIVLTTSAIGAQIGIRLGVKVSPEKLRILLALLIFYIITKLILGFVIAPDNLYTILMKHN